MLFRSSDNAPMIKRCPVTMECRLARTFDFETHDVFVGEIIETYADESVLTDKRIDISKVHPLLFDMNSLKYWSLGAPVAKCWNKGKELKRQL